MNNPITEENYIAAIEQENSAKKVINAYLKQKASAFQRRLESGVPFTDEELVYAAYDLCPCGYGVAYPKNCGPLHYWECSAILKGTADKEARHCGQMPFTMYSIKSEIQPSAEGSTTRGVFRPKTGSPVPA